MTDDEFILLNRAGKPLRSLEDWQILAAPASASHWVEYRSAMELAKLWLSGEGARLVAATLASQPALGNFAARRAVAEANTSFDRYPGGPRNHDLLVEGTTSGGSVFVSIEGKADEPFGETVTEYAARAAAKLARGEPTNAPARLHDLLAAIAGTTLAETPELGALRYQLFSGIAGALAAAPGARAAVFFVQEFETPLTSPGPLARNADDLGAMLRLLGLEAPSQEPWCVGPVHVPGSEFVPADVPLYVAKVRVRVPSR